MKWLIGSLVAFDVAAFLFVVALVVRGVWGDLKHRGEDPIDGHAEDAMALLGVQVPQGTGERIVHDFFEWLDKEKQG